MQYLLSGLLGLMCCFLSCTNTEKTESPSAQESTTILSSQDSAMLESRPHIKKLVEENGIATLIPEQKTWDFGELAQDTVAKHQLKFTNTSENPLIISTIYASCPCAYPSSYPDTVAAGAEGVITLRFDTQHKRGAQHKTLTIWANTMPIVTRLNIVASIVTED